VFDNVVVGVGEYESGRDALELAKTLASEDGQIALVFVERVVSAPATTGLDAERQQYGLGRLVRLRDEAHSAADVARVQAESLSKGLYDFAIERGADLIVIGASRGNQLQHMVSGEDAREVLEDPPCTVGVAPAGYSTHSNGIGTIGVAHDGSPEGERALALAKTIAAERRAALSEFDEDTVEAVRSDGPAVDLLVVPSHRHDPPDRRPERSRSERLAQNPSSPLLVVS
jgi:nucleotide-binding universal stress UspA family protein